MANEALDSDERQALLSPPPCNETTANNRTSEEGNPVSFGALKFAVAIIGKWTAMQRNPCFARIHVRYWSDAYCRINAGVFLPNADTSLVVATYSSIASEFNNQADGTLILTAYQLGYSVALTVVSEKFHIFPTTSVRLESFQWLA